MGNNKKSHIFFGWWTVFALGLVCLLGGCIAFQSFSVFFKPLAADLGLSRAVTSTAVSVQAVVMSVCAPLGGWASDKYGPRRVLLIGISILSLGCILMFFVHGLWAFLIVMGVLIGGGASLGATMITDRAVVNWFVKKSGVAINTKFAISSLSGLLILPVIAWLIKTVDWRLAYVVSGITLAVVAIPLVWFFVKPHPPEHYGLLPDGDKQATGSSRTTRVSNTSTREQPDLTFRQALKTPAFWLIIGIGYGMGVVTSMMGTHYVPFLTDRGIDSVEAAAMLGLMTTVAVPVRLVMGFIVDRIPNNRLRFLLALGTLMQVAGVGIFLLIQTTASIYIWLVLFGIGGGIRDSANFPMLARYFGRKAFGSITGLFSPLQLPIGLVAPIFIGWVYDTKGSYMSIIYLMVGLLIAVSIAWMFLVPPKVPAKKVDLVR